MTLEALGNLGEFVSAIAVLATLIYLAVQVKHAKNEAMGVSRIARGTAIRELMTAQANSTELPFIYEKMFVKGAHNVTGIHAFLMEKYELTYAEAYRVARDWFAWMKYQESLFKHLGPEERDTQDRLLHQFVSTLWHTEMWEHGRANFDVGFAAHVDELIN